MKSIRKSFADHFSNIEFDQFIDGELPAPSITNLEDHLASCVGCRREFRTRQTLILQLDTALSGSMPLPAGFAGAIAKAAEMVANDPVGWMPQQFENPANPAVHERTTGPEIWADTAGQIDAIVAGVGTGGTITGVARYIKKLNPNFKAIAVEPKQSPVISGGQPGKHRIQGIGAGFVPKNLDRSVIDDVIQVDDELAFEWGRKLASKEGIMAGISSGANMWAAAQIAARPEFKGKRIVTIMCSLGERYLSTPLFGNLGT